VKSLRRQFEPAWRCCRRAPVPALRVDD